MRGDNMLNVRLPEGVEMRLERLSKETGRSKSYYVKKAIEQYLEDREDYLLAVATLEKKNPTISLEQLERELGLENRNR